jgi:hypothetical protein
VRASGAGREALSLERAQLFEWLVRGGFAARGLTYGVMGGLALALALGAGTAGNAPSQQGALALIDKAPLGVVALILIAAGLLAYSVWKISRALLGRGPEGGGDPDLKDRVFNFCGGAAYLVFFAVALRVLVEGPGGGGGSPRQTTAGILSWPGGRFIVGLAGAILIGVSAYQVFDALTGRFAEEAKTGEMGARERDVFMRLGRVGITARAIVFALVGYFLLRAAIDYKPSSAVGVDGVLGRLHAHAYGPWLLGLAAAGLLLFAAYSFFEGRYRRL